MFVRAQHFSQFRFSIALIMPDQQSFIVTARKWRPLRFSDVVGQEHITTTLINAITAKRVHHAYLFTGPRGVGKTTCARILARALNCLNPKDNEPCNECTSCTDILDGRSVDVIEIDGASNNSVDDIRKLRDNAKYAPLNGTYKMYIIDEVHMLSTAAFNALLKTLEEPPSHLVFVFATTEIHKLPATILSRCQRFDFRRMEVASMVDQLGIIAKAEKIEIDEESLVAISRKADGSMRDSQSIFDQVVSFCGTTIKGSDVRDALHLIDADFYFEISDAARDHDLKAMFDLSRQVVQRGYDLQECLIGLLEHFRNILTVQATSSTELIEGAEATAKRYAAEAERITQQDVIRIMALIAQGESILRHNPPQPRVRFEFTLVQLASMDAAVDLGELLDRLGAGSSPPVGGTTMAVKVGNLRKVSRPVRPMRATQSVVSSLSSKNMSEKWATVLSELPEHLAFVRSTVKQGMLKTELTEVGLVLRPGAEVIHHRLADKLPDLKEHLLAVYGTKIAVNLMPAPASHEDEDSDSALSGIANSSELLPVEKLIIELFKARPIAAQRPNN